MYIKSDRMASLSAVFHHHQHLPIPTTTRAIQSLRPLLYPLQQTNIIIMQFTTTVLAFLAAASTSLATPVPEPAVGVSMMAAAGTTWTIQNFKRTCTSDAKSCNYSFGINTNDGSAATKCSYQVTGNPAARASYNSVACGNFRIGSTWSNQFGAGQEFQTLSVVRNGQ